MLTRIVLPPKILDYFETTVVEQTSTEIHIHLDELIDPNMSDEYFESECFMKPAKVTDFPIWDHKVILIRDIQ